MQHLLKRIFILVLVFFFVVEVFAQVTLTFLNNGPVAGDSSRTREISYISPGFPGENMVWDLSGIKYTGKSIFSGVKEDPSPKIAGRGEQSLVLTEEGYDYFYLFGEAGGTETGYVNPVKKMSLQYDDPVARMKYPLSYGGQFSDPFSGVAWYNQSSRIEISGTYTVTADAFGTLILPDRIVKSTLRVKIVKQSLQMSVCGSYQSTIVKYYWYAPGYRYPVLMISDTEKKYGVNEPVVVKDAWVNVEQHMAGDIAAGADSKAPSEAGANSVIVYPNPFTGQVTYDYFLRKQIPVAVELYDMSGRFNLKVEPKQVQAEGLHTGVVNGSAHAMPPGVYYLRFTFDRQVVVTKIVKI